MAVAKAAMATGVARLPIETDAMRPNYADGWTRAMPTFSACISVFKTKAIAMSSQKAKKRAIRAALEIRSSNLGHPILVGKRKIIEAQLEAMGLSDEKRTFAARATNT